LIKDISPRFSVIEKDATLKAGLEEILGEKGEIIIDDVLQVQMKQDGVPLFIVGNLPYYITSPILRKFFTAEQFPSSTLQQQEVVGGLFMVQAEVGEKIKADASKKSYLYRLLNYAYEVRYLKTIPAKAFNPPPKVKSCLISLVQKTELPEIPFTSVVNFLEAVAPYSRKTLGKIAKMLEKRGNRFP
jgi:16S rRNA (adenine1518-N6/adenine1519-N6)-dimethyltransferase